MEDGGRLIKMAHTHVQFLVLKFMSLKEDKEPTTSVARDGDVPDRCAAGRRRRRRSRSSPRRRTTTRSKLKRDHKKKIKRQTPFRSRRRSPHVKHVMRATRAPRTVSSRAHPAARVALFIYCHHLILV